MSAVDRTQSAIDAHAVFFDEDEIVEAEAAAHLLADLIHWADAQTPRIDLEQVWTIARDMVCEDRRSA